jgi:hypothetical protein
MYGLIRCGNEIWQYVDEGGAHVGDAQRIYYRYKQRLDGFGFDDCDPIKGDFIDKTVTRKSGKGVKALKGNVPLSKKN